MSHPSRPRADHVLRGGKVVTVDDEWTVAEAIALRGDKVLAVGSVADVDGTVGPETTVTELRGATVVPGLIDNHVHLALAGLDLPEVGVKVNIIDQPSIAGIMAEIRRKADSTPAGEWVVTSCMYRSGLAEGRFPDRHDLDAVSTRHPIYIMQSGKNIVVNSHALELAGLDDGVSDPADPEGHFVRDEEGVLTGHLVAGAADMLRKRCWERTGQRPVMWDFLSYPAEVRTRAIQAMMAVYNSCGVTSCREMGLAPDELDAYTTLRGRGEMTVRVNALLGLPARYLRTDEVVQALHGYFGPKQGFGDTWLRVGGVKMVMHNDGYWSLSREKAEALLLEANRQGWTVAIHVGSPEAAELVLDLLERADAEVPLAGRRFTIEHRYQRFDRAAYAKLAGWGVIVAANPQLTYMAAGRAYKMHQVLDRVRLMKRGDDTAFERAVRWYGMPMRDWVDAGIVVTGGTDNPAVAYDADRPLLGYYMAVTGDTEAGVLLPGQELSREEALRAYTIAGAYATFEEDMKGSLEPGKLADLTVLSGDPLTATPADLLRTRVLTTMVGGQVVYES